MSLREKLKQKKEFGSIDDTTLRKLQSDYVTEVKNLTDTVKTWFADMVKENLASISGSKCQVFDKHLGEYTVDSIVVNAGEDAVIFMPMGAEVFGAYGRVDFFLQGKKNLGKKLLLAGVEGHEGTYSWIFWEPNSPLHKKKLEQTLFLKILEDWIE